MVQLTRSRVAELVGQGFTLIRHTGKLSDVAPIFKVVMREQLIPGQYLIRTNEVLGPIEVIVTETEIIETMQKLTVLLQDYLRGQK